MPHDDAPDSLPGLADENWSRVLCVAAHPDDLEYGTSAAVRTWTDRGIEVAYLLLTAGEAGMADPPDVVRPLRAGEQRRACDTVGVTQLTILDHPDGMLEPGLELRRSVAREIRRFRPDAVVTGDFAVEVSWGLNQADHRAAGLAVVDGVRDAANRWVFRELSEEEGLDPWSASVLLVAGSSQADRALVVDASAVEAAVASLRCHEAYLRHVTGHPDPGEIIPMFLREQGQAAGSEYAVAFRAYDLR